jgi:hypothetical protein
MKPVVAQLRKQGIRLIIYLDDILIMAETETLANQHAQTTCNLLEALGFVINYQKSTLIPSKKMEFLGFLVDSQAPTLALPRDKIRSVKKECQNLLDLQLVIVRELAKILGHLTSTIQDDCSFADGQCVRSTLHKQDGRIGAYSTKSF